MTPLYHGISVRDAAMMCGVPETNVRKWLERGILIRTGDGQICPFSLREWWDAKRDMDKAARNPAAATRRNPYRIPTLNS